MAGPAVAQTPAAPQPRGTVAFVEIAGDPPHDPSPPLVTDPPKELQGFVGHTAKSKTLKTRVAVSYLRTKSGKRFLVVRVTSSKSRAKVRVVLIGKHGRKLGKVTRVVRTNRLVSIRVKSSVRKARVSLAR